MPELAQKIDDAVRNVLQAGAYTPDVKSSGAVSTSEFTELVCERLK